MLTLSRVMNSYYTLAEGILILVWGWQPTLEDISDLMEYIYSESAPTEELNYQCLSVRLLQRILVSQFLRYLEET